MKKWERYEDHNKPEVHTLALGHNLDEIQVIVELYRDYDGDWRTSSDLLKTTWSYLAGKEVSERDAKILVEKMVYNHYEDQIKYYQEICQELAGS